MPGKYYVFRPLVGSDPKYLPFLHNLRECRKLGGDNNFEGYLVVDDDSLKMLKETLLDDGSGKTYESLVGKSGFQIMHAKDMIKRVYSDKNLRQKAKDLYQKVVDLGNYDVGDGSHVAVMPAASRADFIRGLSLLGFSNAEKGSLNYYADIDVMMSSDKKLPEDPKLLDVKVAKQLNAVRYKNPFNDKSYLQKIKDAGLQDQWDRLQNGLKSGRTHIAYPNFDPFDGFLDDNKFVMRDNKLVERDKVQWSPVPEVMMANPDALRELSGNLISEYKKSIEWVEDVVKRNGVKAAMAQMGNQFVYKLVPTMYRALDLYADGRIDDELLLPGRIGVAGRFDCETWIRAGANEKLFYPSPNVEKEEVLNPVPWIMKHLPISNNLTDLVINFVRNAAVARVTASSISALPNAMSNAPKSQVDPTETAPSYTTALVVSAFVGAAAIGAYYWNRYGKNDNQSSGEVVPSSKVAAESTLQTVAPKGKKGKVKH